MSDYQGKVVIVMNVASKCGLTNKNYTQMTEIHQQYKDKGLEVLAFPCNQFLWQEPANEQTICSFVKNKFGAEFQMFSKVDVNGQNAHDVFKWLRRNCVLSRGTD